MDHSILSNGAIQACIDGKGPPKPCLQVLGIKKIASNDRASGDRFRLQLSDGLYYQPGMMATQLNNKVVSGELEKFAVIQVEKLVISTVQNKKIMVVINFSVLHSGSSVNRVLGTPKNLEITICENGTTAATTSKPVPQHQSTTSVRPPLNTNQQSYPTFGNNQRSNVTSTPPPPFKQQQQQQQVTPTKSFYGARSNNKPYSPSFSGTSSSPQTQITNRNVFPIASLNPYQNKWTIKARVTSKPTLRTYSNSRGEGRVMSVELIDHSGEIKGTGFNEDADRLYPILQLNKVYLVSRGRLKPANRQYNSCKNDYEINFSSETEIEECVDGVDDVPALTYNFKPIAALESMPKESVVDVIGICTACPEAQTIVTRTTNKQLSKRDITLTDKSSCSVSCTIWGTEAEGFDASVGSVVALKSVRTSDFNGVSISCMSSTTISIDPDMPEAHNLRGWYDGYGKNQPVNSLSVGGGSFSSSQTPFLNCKQVKEADIGRKDKPDYFSCKGTIIYAKRENLLYKACPKPDCNKKVVEDASERYMCEKCGYNGLEFKYRMIMKMNVADFSGNLWADCFNESAETIVGMNSQSLGEIKDTDVSKFDMVLDEINFKDCIFKYRAKVDTYNEEQRLRCSAVSVTHLNYNQESKRLLEEIKALMIK